MEFESKLPYNQPIKSPHLRAYPGLWSRCWENHKIHCKIWIQHEISLDIIYSTAYWVSNNFNCSSASRGHTDPNPTKLKYIFRRNLVNSSLWVVKKVIQKILGVRGIISNWSHKLCTHLIFELQVDPWGLLTHILQGCFNGNWVVMTVQVLVKQPWRIWANWLIEHLQIATKHKSCILFLGCSM